MKIYDWEKKLTIDTIFPHEMFESYLFKTKVVDQDKMTLSQIDKIFLLARDDFRSGKLGFDEFSDICNVLFGKITSMVEKGKTNQLFDVLLAGAELTFYARSRDDVGLNQLKYFLDDVNNYKEKRKT